MTFAGLHGDCPKCQCIKSGYVENTTDAFIRDLRGPELTIQGLNNNWEDGEERPIGWDADEPTKAVCSRVCDMKGLSLYTDLAGLLERRAETRKFNPDAVAKRTHYCSLRFLTEAGLFRVPGQKTPHRFFFKCDAFTLAHVVVLETKAHDNV